MTIHDFINLTPEDISKMTFGERVELVDEMSKHANKRLKKLDENLVHISQAMFSRIDDEGNIMWFTSRGKNNQQLSNELKHLRKFLSNKTSTVTGAKKAAVKLYRKVLGGDKYMSYNDIKDAFSTDPQKMNNFWSAYNKVLERNIGIISTKERVVEGGYPSNQVQQMVYEMMVDNPEWDSDELWKKIEKILRDGYEPPETQGENPFTFVKK